MSANTQRGLLSRLRPLVGKRAAPEPVCTHLDQIAHVRPDSDGCEACRAAGDTWVYLRTCLTCGRVGCCDDSKNRHARAHAYESGHPIVRSIEPGERWVWCFVDEVFVAPD